MTRAQLIALQPGDIIRHKWRRTLRIVVSGPGRTKRGTLTGVALVKIGRSWTDPNPCAFYDRDIIEQEYSVTGSRGMSPKAATKLRTWKPDRKDLAKYKRRFHAKRKYGL